MVAGPQNRSRASLEALVESDPGIEILHPGGLELTRELAELCHTGPDKRLPCKRIADEKLCVEAAYPFTRASLR